MKLEVTKVETCKYELQVEVEAPLWEEAQNKALKKLAKDVTVQGFRKGKAPEHLLRDKIAPGKILDEGIKLILNDAFQFAINESDHMPIMQPSYDIVKISDKELVLKFLVVTAPAVEIGQYKDLEIGHEDLTVSDAAVNDKLNALRTDNAELVLKEAPAELGDTVVLDFEGLKDGVPFEGGKAENHELSLGSGQFIPGFEEQLVGVTAGEKRDLDITFPENYHASLKGQKVVFKTHTHEVKAKKVPELTDEFAASLNLPNVSDLASLRVSILFDLTKELEQTERDGYVKKLLAKIRENSKIEISEDLIHQEGHQLQHNFEDQLKNQGLTIEDYKTMNNETDEQIHDSFHEQARVNLENHFILSEIAKKEEIEVSEADVDFEVAKMAQQYNMSEEKVREILGENLKNLKNDIRFQRTISFLVENNK